MFLLIHLLVNGGIGNHKKNNKGFECNILVVGALNIIVKFNSKIFSIENVSHLKKMFI